MIQRIQTVYLLLAVAVSAVLLFLPVATIRNLSPGGEAVGVVTVFSAVSKSESFQTPMPVWVLGMFLILGEGLRVAAVFGYKNRRNQLRTCRSSLLADVCFLVLTAVLCWQVAGGLPESMALSLVPYHAVVCPFFSVVFTLLAMRGIRHDERLVRAADRLR